MPSQREYESVEAYLRQINGTLFHPFGIRERQQALREIAQHLRDMIDANLAAGLSKEEATRNALEEFGNPNEIAKQLILEFRRARFRKYGREQVQETIRSFFWTVIVAFAAFLLKFWISVEDFEKLLVYGGMVSSAGCAAYFAGKFLTKQRRRANR